MANLKTFNLEAGYPTLEEARRILAAELRTARREKAKLLKIIHGYGASGQGGVLRIGLRKSLRLRKKEGLIADFIPGEDLTIFNRQVLELLEAVPELRADPDLRAGNEGVTLIVL